MHTHAVICLFLGNVMSPTSADTDAFSKIYHSHLLFNKEDASEFVDASWTYAFIAGENQYFESMSLWSN